MYKFKYSIIEYLRYSGFLFRNIDRSNTGFIRFEDLVVTLSILIKGSIEDRLSWIFDLYDLDKDGILTRMVKYIEI
jgi:Ca2+-binding EF-hand superfamily protein